MDTKNCFNYHFLRACVLRPAGSREALCPLTCHFYHKTQREHQTSHLTIWETKPKVTANNNNNPIPHSHSHSGRYDGVHVSRLPTLGPVLWPPPILPETRPLSLPILIPTRPLPYPPLLLSQRLPRRRFNGWLWQGTHS